MTLPIQLLGVAGVTGVRTNRTASGTPAALSADPAPTPADDAGSEALARAVEAVNKMLDPMARGLQFSIDESTGKTVVKLVDKETNEVIRQMPSRELLAIAHALDRVQGLLFHQRA